MDQVWREAPVAALRLTRRGASLAVERNAAARAWAVADADWQRLATAQIRLPAGEDSLHLGHLRLRCRRVAVSDGLLLWLTPLAEPAPADALEGERIALLRALGRIGLFVRDLQGGAGRWDACMFEITGLDPAQGAPDWPDFLQRCVHPDDRAALDAHYSAVQGETGRGDLHFRVCRPDGEERWVHSLYDIRPGADGAPAQLVGVMLDDSTAGRRLQEGERSRRFLQRALELSGVSVWRTDLATQRVYFSAVGYDVVHMTPDVAGVSLEQLRQSIHPQDVQAIAQAAEQAVHSDGVVDVVARYISSQGEWRRLLTRRVAERDAAGQAIGLMGVLLDVTERDAERARADALAEQSRLVAQAMGLGFWQRDGNGESVMWDAQMYRLYGRSEERPPPTMLEWIAEYVLPVQRDAVRSTLEADVAAWAPATLMTVAVCGDDGVQRHVRAWTRRYEREGRRIATGMHLDVTEQLRHEDVQREAERTARASREKSAFMALMSHRLRTPLNAVLGFAQLMSQDGHDALSARQRERLARIDAAGHELLAMIDDVFELAALDAESALPARRSVPLGAVITQLREAVEPLARQRGVALRVADLPAGLHLATDRRLLGQSLLHLTAHAVRRNERGGWVELRVLAEPGWCRLELRDGGPQLTPRQRELLFDTPTMPAPQASHGDALVGLDLVRQALERLGGQIHWLHPQATDSALVVRLPLGAAEPAGDAPSLKLLCVEDNPVNLMLVQELVAMRPALRFFSATDGESGLALARAERPDVVLLDLHLPDIPGQQVLARLRADEDLARCRVIALSANAMPDDIRQALALGFDDYWTKPIDFDQFLAGLDRLASGGLRARAVP
jgi:signal transduction histidine kinase/ActR/RegA family two-component response regulator